MSEGLPKGWVSCPLDTVIHEAKSGFASGEKDVPNGLRQLRMNNIGVSGELLLDLIRTVPKNATTSNGLLERGDVLVCTTNSAKLVGKCALFDESGEWAYSNHLTRLRSRQEVILPVFLKWTLWSRWKSGTYDDLCKHWVNQSALPKEALLATVIDLPPINEQRRIVAKLETLLAKVDASRKRLERIPVILKRFRQAVLAAAREGRLTEDWRGENEVEETASASIQRIHRCWAASFQKACDEAIRKGNRRPQRPRNNFTPVIQEGSNGIPDTWCETRIGDIAECLDSMRVPINQSERAVRQGNIPYYGANGQVGWIDQHLFDESLVLVVEDETFVGREKPFSYVIEGKAWVNNHAHVLRPLGGMLVQYLNICLSYYNFTPLTSGTTGRRKLTQEALLEAPLLLAPPSEQVEITKRASELLDLADQIEARYTKAKAQVDRLTQSILAKAFRGELVPQNPNDEPAEVLLSRLAGAPSEASAQVRRRGRSPRVQPAAPPLAPASPAEDHQAPALVDPTPEAIHQAHREVLATIRSPLAEDDLLRAIALRLGFRRLGARIKSRLLEVLAPIHAIVGS